MLNEDWPTPEATRDEFAMKLHMDAAKAELRRRQQGAERSPMSKLDELRNAPNGDKERIAAADKAVRGCQERARADV